MKKKKKKFVEVATPENLQSLLGIKTISKQEILVFRELEHKQIISVKNKTPYIQHDNWNSIWRHRDQNSLHFVASNQCTFENVLIIDKDLFVSQMKYTEKEYLDNATIKKWLKKMVKVIPLFENMGIDIEHVKIVFVTNAKIKNFHFESHYLGVPFKIITKDELEKITHINRTQKVPTPAPTPEK